MKNNLTSDNLRKRAERLIKIIEKNEKENKRLKENVKALIKGAIEIEKITDNIKDSDSLAYPKKQTQLEKLTSIFETHGPMERKELRETYNFSNGTLSFLLSKKEFFEKNKDTQKWGLKNNLQIDL